MILFFTLASKSLPTQTDCAGLLSSYMKLNSPLRIGLKVFILVLVDTPSSLSYRALSSCMLRFTLLVILSTFFLISSRQQMILGSSYVFPRLTRTGGPESLWYFIFKWVIEVTSSNAVKNGHVIVDIFTRNHEEKHVHNPFVYPSMK